MGWLDVSFFTRDMLPVKLDVLDVSRIPGSCVLFCPFQGCLKIRGPCKIHKSVHQIKGFNDTMDCRAHDVKEDLFTTFHFLPNLKFPEWSWGV